MVMSFLERERCQVIVPLVVYLHGHLPCVTFSNRRARIRHYIDGFMLEQYEKVQYYHF